MAVQQGEATLSGSLPPVQILINGAQTNIFSGLIIIDPDADAQDTATIWFDGTAGSIEVARGYSGAPLTYPYRPYGFDQVAQISDKNAADLSNDLNQVVFIPHVALPGQTSVDVSIESGSGGSIANYSLQIYVPSGPAISFNQNVDYYDGSFIITGKVASSTFAASVEVTAQVDGVVTDLGSAKVDASGGFSFKDDIGTHAQSFFSVTATNNAGDTITSADPLFSLEGGLADGEGKQHRYSADGSAETATDLFNANGSQKVGVFASGQTFASSSFDKFQNHGAPLSTFVFNPGAGRDVVSLFRVDGADHDTLSFKGSDFGATPSAQLAAVLANSRDTAAGLLITDPTASTLGGGPGTHDTLLLKGVTKDQLATNTADITFHA